MKLQLEADTARAHQPRARTALMLGALAAAIAAAGGCSTPEARARDSVEPPAQQVTTQLVTKATLPRALMLTGTLRAKRDAAVAADVSGVVRKTLHERGDLVRTGTPLLQLDARSAELGLAEADALSATIDAENKQAQRECERAALLHASGALAAAEHERAEGRCLISARTAHVTRVRFDAAQKSLHDQLVRAPFGGRVVERFVSTGEYVSPQRPLFRVVDDSHIVLELSIPESESGHVALGAELSFGVAAHPGRTFVAQIVRVSPVLRSLTRDLLAEAELVNTDGALRAGMIAVGSLPVGTVELPVVPVGALIQAGETTHAFVVREHVIEERIVRLGPRQAQLVGIEAGLSLGDVVVSVVDPNVRDGVRVR